MKFNPPKKVRCINNDTVPGFLTVGNVYDVVESQDGYDREIAAEYYFLAPHYGGHGFLARRFVPVEDSDSQTAPTTVMSCNSPAMPNAPMATASFDFETYNSLWGLPGKK